MVIEFEGEDEGGTKILRYFWYLYLWFFFLTSSLFFFYTSIAYRWCCDCACFIVVVLVECVSAERLWVMMTRDSDSDWWIWIREWEKRWRNLRVICVNYWFNVRVIVWRIERNSKNSEKPDREIWSDFRVVIGDFFFAVRVWIFRGLKM